MENIVSNEMTLVNTTPAAATTPNNRIKRPIMPNSNVNSSRSLNLIHPYRRLASGANSPTPPHSPNASPSTSPYGSVSPRIAVYTPIKNAFPYHQQHQHYQQQQQPQHHQEQSQPQQNQSQSDVIINTDLRQTKPLNIIKERYVVSSHRYEMSPTAAAKTPASYRHLIDLTSSHLRCTDIFTKQQYLCKIINEPMHKVQYAYFKLLHTDAENCRSTIYGHSLIRGIHDVVHFNEQRAYVIVAPPPPPTSSSPATSPATPTTSSTTTSTQTQTTNNNTEQQTINNGVDYYYEDLHTYIRNKRRLGEPEARALFHQICQTVQVCHRNGIILRDLKLKRFYFIDEARTKLQYESLEGSMILDEPNDDTLRDKIGCPLYTAPELLCQNATYRGKPADMWSLGVLLYTMLVGQYPFYEKGNCSLITVIRHCQVQIPTMLSRSVRWLLLSLLRKNHEERMRAEHILYAPWLREQRPYYMYIPANVCLPLDEQDEEDSGTDSVDIDGDDEYVAMHEEQETEIQLMASSTSRTIINAPATTTTATTTTPPEPLDYTCATLQTTSTTTTQTTSARTRNSDNSSNVNENNDNNVDMG